MAKRQGGKKRSGTKKYGRQKAKMVRRGSPISAFVRGNISAQDYWKLSNIKAPHRGGF